MSRQFDRVLIVMFENQYRRYVMQDPFMRKLAEAGADMANYFGAFHPSQTNYIASLAAEVCAVTNDTPPAEPLLQQTLVDLLEDGGISWKAYMEDYPGNTWNPAWQQSGYPSSDQPLNEYPGLKSTDLARFYRKHNAFASFHTIQRDEKRWARIVGATEFWTDVESDSLPEYGWFTPNIWNDGHYLHNTHVDTDPRTQLVPQISRWLEYVFLGRIAGAKVQGGSGVGQGFIGLNLDLDLLLTDPAAAWSKSRVPKGTLIVVTFDEADFDATGYDTNYDGPNQVYTVLLGDMIRPGTFVQTPYNHYSLIRTIERNYEIGDLGKNDRDANWFRFLWNEKFAWSDPAPTGIATAGHIALTSPAATQQGPGGAPNALLAFDEGGGSIMSASLQDGAWSDPESTGLKANGRIAMATVGDVVHLVMVNDDQLLRCSYQPGEGWSEARPMNLTASGGIALSAYNDYADQRQKLMLCWTGQNGFIRFLIFDRGEWQGEPGDVGQLTDGPMALRQLGPSLFLVYKERNTRKLRMTTFNLGPFNAFHAVDFTNDPAPANDTSLHAWSPFDVHVGHFAGKSNTVQNDYQALGDLAMATIEGGEMHLVHRGAYRVTPTAFTEIFGLTGIFTASQSETNGFGTMRQAGWTREQEYSKICLDPDNPIAMASDGSRLLMVWRDAGTGQALQFCVGSYGV